MSPAMPDRDPRRPFITSVSLMPERVPSFDTYPFDLPAVAGLRRMGELPLHPAVTFLVGENGSGKSTLLEAIAVALDMNAEGGGKNFNFQTRPSHSPLFDALYLARDQRRRPADTFFLRAESFYNVATEIERMDAVPSPRSPPIGPAYGPRPLHEVSHGEAFLALFTHRLRENGLYLLDEPEAALSPMRQLAFLTALHDLAGPGASQLVIATHSPIVLAYPDAWIYQLAPAGITRVAYKDTEHYRVTKQFLDRPERMLELLLADERG
jgi:predicted ATPase